MFFFFNDTATTEIYTLSLHDALPISLPLVLILLIVGYQIIVRFFPIDIDTVQAADSVLSERWRSEEHTSELQSRSDLVCRLLLAKKNIRHTMTGDGGLKRV